MSSEPSMPMGMSRWGFLASCAATLTPLEADIGEEDHAGGAEHAGPAELPEVPVLGGMKGV